MSEGQEGARPASDIRPGEVITQEDALRAEAAEVSGTGGLSTAELAGRSRDADRNRGPDAAERAEPAAVPPPGSSRPAAREEGAAPLFDRGNAEGYRARWSEVQTGFVDDPRRAVEQADGLVAEVMQRLAEVFAEQRAKLEQQWDQGDNVDTEGLRLALRRYRSFFDRLLSM